MPFKSKSQQGYLYAKHPDIAAEFVKKTGDYKSLPEHVRKKKKKMRDHLTER